MKIVYGQYNSNEFKLNRFFICEIPTCIKKSILKLSKDKDCIVRGGFSYGLLANSEYILKDIDMYVETNDVDDIISCLQNCDVVYVNKNTKNETVISAFWKFGDGFIKMDILIGNCHPETEVIIWDNNKISSVSKTYIWVNRLIKIAEKKERNYDDVKIKNHFNVASHLTKVLIKQQVVIKEEYKNVIQTKIVDIKRIIEPIVGVMRSKDFIEKIEYLLKG